jgi:hypothetical protein
MKPGNGLGGAIGAGVPKGWEKGDDPNGAGLVKGEVGGVYGTGLLVEPGDGIGEGLPGEPGDGIGAGGAGAALLLGLNTTRGVTGGVLAAVRTGRATALLIKSSLQREQRGLSAIFLKPHPGHVMNFMRFIPLKCQAGKDPINQSI